MISGTLAGEGRAHKSAFKPYRETTYSKLEHKYSEKFYNRRFTTIRVNIAKTKPESTCLGNDSLKNKA